MRRGSAGRAAGLVVPAILLLVGFLVTATLVEESRREERLPSRTAELLDLIRTRQAGVAELSAETRSLSARLRELQGEAAMESDQLGEALAAVDSLRLPASVGPARGPGLTVVLSDSEALPRTGGEATDLRIQDVDIRLVVNALWRSGAEAVAVNEHRVGGTTAIRAAGDRILVNFSPIASPYRVTAIGDPERLESGLRQTEIGQQFDVWTQVYGLGFAVQASDELKLPGPDAGPLSWARPVEEG
jgi:uncharacterized protein YlxW (UPF0749 family)